MFFYGFDVLMLEIKKKSKKNILMHFQLKNTFKKHFLSHYQIHTKAT